mmetsp:Transcript_82127/g.235963  ORF Transcript_82127/g.235963 Transcript_82127/m.235963 type:complete len:230 (-) Transcript_82127:383-1072(-)
MATKSWSLCSSLPATKGNLNVSPSVSPPEASSNSSASGLLLKREGTFGRTKTVKQTSAAKPSGKNNTFQKRQKPRCGKYLAHTSSNTACTPCAPKTAEWSVCWSPALSSAGPRPRRTSSIASIGRAPASATKIRRSNCQSYHVRKSRKPTTETLTRAATMPSSSASNVAPKSTAVPVTSRRTEVRSAVVEKRNQTKLPETGTDNVTTRPKMTLVMVSDMIHIQESNIPT